MSGFEATSKSFMKVPEMRLAIWDALIPPPRRIYMEKSSIPLSDDRCWKAKVSFDPGSPAISNPSVLHICAESRDYFIREKGYTLLSRCLISPIYLNYSRDQLWFDSLSRLWRYAKNVSYRHRLEIRNCQMSEEKMQPYKIRKLGMRLTERNKIERFSARIMIHIMKRLTELEEITFELPKRQIRGLQGYFRWKITQLCGKYARPQCPRYESPSETHLHNAGSCCSS
ncbi:hypothetical protein H4I96_05334 [Botrytis cinerea]